MTPEQFVANLYNESVRRCSDDYTNTEHLMDWTTGVVFGEKTRDRKDRGYITRSASAIGGSIFFPTQEDGRFEARVYSAIYPYKNGKHRLLIDVPTGNRNHYSYLMEIPPGPVVIVTGNRDYSGADFGLRAGAYQVTSKHENNGEPGHASVYLRIAHKLTEVFRQGISLACITWDGGNRVIESNVYAFSEEDAVVASVIVGDQYFSSGETQ